MLFQKNQTILFQGDSITDAGRIRENGECLGFGYAFMIAAQLMMQYPDLDLKFVNRGVGGDRTCDLLTRWQNDCLDIQPDWLSIMIGINNVWRRYDNNDPTDHNTFEREYRQLLQQVKAKTNARIIIIEPFVLPTPGDRIKWRDDLDPKIQITRQLAAEYADVFLPMDGLLNAAAIHKNPEYWAADGVHPTAPGHAFIAAAFVKTITCGHACQ